MNVLVPGGCGYVGAMLVPHLLSEGHKVTVIDLQWFGNAWLPEDNGKLKVLRQDISNIDAFHELCKEHEAIIYLAGLTNNDFYEKERTLGDMVNRNIFPYIIDAAKSAKVKRFIFASSVAAYGSSDHDATENEMIEPTTLYARAKAFCEYEALLHTEPSFAVTITRSASVCGESSRMRFDTTVNKMTHDAMRAPHVITVNGGEQKRSHIHMHDLCRAYKRLLNVPSEVVEGEIFNLVGENQTVMQTAEIVSECTGAALERRPRSDNRSYSVSGEKARKALDFVPRKTVREAVEYMVMHFRGGKWKDTSHPNYMNFCADVA